MPGPSRTPLLTIAHDPRRLRRQLVGSGLGVLAATALMGYFLWLAWREPAAWLLVVLWVLPTLLPLATFADFVAVARRRDRSVLQVFDDHVLVAQKVVVPWRHIRRVSVVDEQGGTLAGGRGKWMSRVSVLARPFGLGDGQRGFNFHLDDYERLKSEAGSAGALHFADPSLLDTTLPTDSAAAYCFVSNELTPVDFWGARQALAAIVAAKGVGFGPSRV